MSAAPAADTPGLPAFFHAQRHDDIDSTNDEAKRLAAAGAPEGTLVVSRRQSGGRGRRGRAWASPPGNLYASLVLRPDGPVGEAAQLSFVAAVALAEALDLWLEPARIGLKWPNDVLVDGAKISGILLESAAGPAGRVDWLVLGIGVNVAHHPEISERPTVSLAATGAQGVEPDAVLEQLATRLDAWYRRWRREGFEPVRRAWLQRAVGLGGPVRAHLTGGTIEGIFRDLDATGALLYRNESGQGRIEAGEVQFGA